MGNLIYLVLFVLLGIGVLVMIILLRTPKRFRLAAFAAIVLVLSGVVAGLFAGCRGWSQTYVFTYDAVLSEENVQSALAAVCGEERLRLSLSEAGISEETLAVEEIPGLIDAGVSVFGERSTVTFTVGISNTWYWKAKAIEKLDDVLLRDFRQELARLCPEGQKEIGPIPETIDVKPQNDGLKEGMMKKEALAAISAMGYIPAPVQHYPNSEGGGIAVYPLRSDVTNGPLLAVKWRGTPDGPALAAWTRVQRSEPGISVPHARLRELLNQP